MNKYHELAREYLADIIRYNTVNKPGNEKPLAERIASVLEKQGFRTELEEVAENRSNVVARLGSSDNRVILTGHLDVVPPGEGWQSDPFELAERDGKLYARGACDMKGGVAAMMAAAVAMKEKDELKDCELMLVFVVDEEITGLGTRYFVKHYKQSGREIAVIGEPTMLETHIAHRGVTRFQIEVNGRQCHSGMPRQGINALTQMAKVLLEIEKIDAERGQEDSGILPPACITATMIRGGVKDNVVPGNAAITLDCRTIPGDTVEKLQARLEKMLAELFDGTEVTYSIEPTIVVPPSAIDPAGRVVSIAKAAHQTVFGKEATVRDFPGCCDMAYLVEAGVVETILCGPGSIDQAHVLDEFVTIEQMNAAVDYYCEIIREAQKQ